MKLSRARKALLLGIAAGLAVAGVLVATQLAGTGERPAVPDPQAGQHGVMLALDERVINLQSGGPFRYAKVGLTIELRPDTAEFYGLTGEARAAAEEAAILDQEASVPLLLDALGTIVSAEDAKTLTTPEGRSALKEDLLEAMRVLLGEGAVLDIYFTNLVMQ